MRVLRSAVAMIAAVSIAACTTTYSAVPIAGPNQEVRYVQGVPTVYSELPQGAVQMTPLGMTNTDLRPVFGIAAYNRGAAPANFGIENITIAAVNGAPLAIYSREELEREARQRAIWGAVALAVVGVTAAVAANNNAHETYRSTLATPRGVYTYTSTYYNQNAAFAGTLAAGAVTGAGLVAIKNTLDATVANLRGQMLQTTTVDPDDSYGGEVVLGAIPAYPSELTVTVRWNDEDHVFRFAMDRQTQ